MAEPIPPVPEGHLPEWKKQALVAQLKADFPDASEHILEQAVHRAARLLWPGLNLVALFASASGVVRAGSE